MKHKSTKGRVARDETLDDFLAEQGLPAEAEELAIKELIAEQIRGAMEREGLTKTVIAARMRDQPPPARPPARLRKHLGDPRHPPPRRSSGGEEAADGAGLNEGGTSCAVTDKVPQRYQIPKLGTTVRTAAPAARTRPSE